MLKYLFLDCGAIQEQSLFLKELKYYQSLHKLSLNTWNFAVVEMWLEVFLSQENINSATVTSSDSIPKLAIRNFDKL